MKLMKPIPSSDFPDSKDWVYEVKYDGFRCVLLWEKDSVRLVSGNDTDLSGNFPEIIETCTEQQSLVENELPLKIDGELVVQNNAYQANFSLIQKRGRLKKNEIIEEMAAARPASFMAFDLLMSEGTAMAEQTFDQRKTKLADIFDGRDKLGQHLYYVGYSKDPNALWQDIFNHKGEGMVAKRSSSIYQPGKKHHDWFKIKNWRTIKGFLTFYDPKNDYFTVCVYRDGEVTEVGKCKHGLDEEAFTALRDLFLSKGTKEEDGYHLPPAICAEIHTLDLLGAELREPEFNRLLTDQAADDCTWEKLKLDLAMLPEIVEPSNTDKMFWPSTGLTKGDLLVYMRAIAPYMLPFLNERLLTIIRCPDGVDGESFFQKHLPDYAPDFIKGIKQNGEMHFVCNHLNSLIWFANHGTVEYHIPFQTVDRENPSEIVFDLDPPDREAFSLAVKAAGFLKQILDDLKLVSFVKTSGGKGLQVHIPIPDESMTYEETGVFTQAIARTLEKGYPDLFTTERFKKKRGDRLYIDYLQHGKDKTLVAPYSPRKREDATVAAPLFWDEVGRELTPNAFTINNVVKRIQTDGCPFARYFETGEKQVMDAVLAMIRK
ncbi:bifunctional non-homologous end joining protein LigD [Lentibacillus halodurans]|uniref:DNA ligase (ATP) n=1 Tax=Lentibacillus halodurans TaxID=237679 RepID=A0A1I0X9K7_9BACI|nr:DNA ligase D [Lentibacillus halodurans]SFA97564.1 bifunctional non-homologous end joining protein LigD [Lentibacillus halodurans]